MVDLASRLSDRVQLTTDVMSGYPKAVAKAFCVDVDYAVLNKTYEAGFAAVEATRVMRGALKRSCAWSSDLKPKSGDLTKRVAPVNCMQSQQSAGTFHLWRVGCRAVRAIP